MRTRCLRCTQECQNAKSRCLLQADNNKRWACHAAFGTIISALRLIFNFLSRVQGNMVQYWQVGGLGGKGMRRRTCVGEHPLRVGWFIILLKPSSRANGRRQHGSENNKREGTPLEWCAWLRVQAARSDRMWFSLCPFPPPKKVPRRPWLWRVGFRGQSEQLTGTYLHI